MPKAYSAQPCWKSKVDTPCPALMPCLSCTELFPVTHFYVLKAGKGRKDMTGIQRHGHCRKCSNESFIKLDPKLKLLYAAKQRANRFKHECTITLDDFEIPAACPVLGIPLWSNVGGGAIGGSNNWNAPTLDRIDNNKGYVPGNVCVISRKANTLKGNGTAAELAAVAAYAALAEPKGGCPSAGAVIRLQP